MGGNQPTGSGPRNSAGARFSIPSLYEIFWGPLAKRVRRISQWRRHGILGRRHVDRRRAFHFEPLEQRLLLSADLVYADLAATPALTQEGIEGYLASVVSTNYTLKAENDAGTLYWRLYGEGTDALPIPSTMVLESVIDDATDLDVNITRDDLGATDIVAGLSLV
ncbi:MAG TPA: LEPR-XLL domain-containing protein, partial [Burkholderiales bacterium]